jgi:hypothetical protein
MKHVTEEQIVGIERALDKLCDEADRQLPRDVMKRLRPRIERAQALGYQINDIFEELGKRLDLKPVTLRGYYYGTGEEKKPAPAPKKRRRAS